MQQVSTLNWSQLSFSDTELESLRIQLNKANYDLSNIRTESERTKLRYENMIRDRETQILIEQKKSEDLQKDRKFLFEKQQSQATELLTLQDEYANYKVPSQNTLLMCSWNQKQISVLIGKKM
jgi:hypothetical protein